MLLHQILHNLACDIFNIISDFLVLFLRETKLFKKSNPESTFGLESWPSFDESVHLVLGEHTEDIFVFLHPIAAKRLRIMLKAPMLLIFPKIFDQIIPLLLELWVFRNGNSELTCIDEGLESAEE